MTARPYVLATLEGYAVEGGFDAKREPATCYAPTIALGRHLGPGIADELWRGYEEVLDVAATTKLDGIRLGVEWARVEPHCDQFDAAALERYTQVARYARSLGLRVTVSLIGEVWPLWLGLEAWLLPWVVPFVVRYARRVLDFMASDVDGVVLFAAAEQLVTRGFLDASAPPWRRRANEDANSARAQIAKIVNELDEFEPFASLLVRDSKTINVDVDSLHALRTADVHEIYVRALVKGKGPTAVPTGLLVRHAGAWLVSPESDFLDALA